ncbi:putative mediator of RNA polymerase II transcription subunit 12 [Anopheles merus]|uniref:putative mediator of RNA polymerase II transcription subunit 12 n=1 Tax=Anopheles merus TaxID=30066 RepID=UPI001BE4CEAB|nr:putative mediator of RNA polymerase II transcription subunit 12 [Anopheles merus]
MELPNRSLRSRQPSVDCSMSAVQKKTVVSAKIDTGRTSLAARSNEENEVRLHLMLQAEKAEKAELMKTVASLQGIVEGLQKQLAEAQQARLSAEADAKKERDALLAEIRDLGKQLRQELCWQRGLQQQAQPGPSVTAAVTLPASQVLTGEDIRQVEQPSFAEVVRRKYRGMAKGKPRQPPQQQQQQQEHQQQQPQQQQQRQPQRQRSPAQRSEQLRQERRRPARPRQDQLIFEPAEGCSYRALFENIRLNPRLADENKGVEQGYRTSRDFLRLSLKKDADAAALLQRIQTEVGDLATGRIITEMAEVLISGIDMLAKKEDVERGLQRALERTAVAATTSIR